MNSPSLRQVIGGTLWMIAMRWVIRLIGIVNVAVIARLLRPADFGLMAVAMISVELCSTLLDGDFDMALVRAPRLSDELRDCGFSLKLLSGAVIFTLLWLLGPVCAAYFDDGRLVWVIRLAGCRPLIQGFENIAVVEFRRSLDFRREFTYLVAQRLLSFSAGLALVWQLRSVYALALSGPVAAMAAIILSYGMAPRRPRWNLNCWRQLWAFSRWQMLFNGSRQLAERIDPFFIGRVADLTQTGLYAVGFEMALLPTREIVMPAGRALMPAYARMAQQQDDMRRGFILALQTVFILACGLAVGLSSVAADAVALLLGGQWQGAAPWVRWLGFYGALESLWLSLDPLLIAGGRERLLAIANAILMVAMIVAVSITVGFIGLGWLPLCRFVVMAAALFLVMSRLLRHGMLNSAALWNGFWRPPLAALAMAGAIAWLRLDPGTPPWLGLLHDVLIGALIYPGVLVILWRLAGMPDGAERQCLALLRRR